MWRSRFAASARLIVPAVFLLSAVLPEALGLAADERPFTLNIETVDGGGFHARATLHVPAPPDAVRAVLTDYERWPQLFAGRFRITKIERREGRVLTDLQIKRFPLPGEMRLLCETRESAGDLMTSLVEGDFSRYERRWTFRDESDGTHPRTRAELDLQFALVAWAPDWLVMMNLRRQLEEHLMILREMAMARVEVR